MNELNDINLTISGYRTIKRKIDSSFSSFDNAIIKLKQAAEDLREGVILEGKPFDKGKLNECSIVLGNIKTHLNSISRNCSYELNELYKQREAILAARRSAINEKTMLF